MQKKQIKIRPAPLSMIRKSGSRFSEKDHAPSKCQSVNRFNLKRFTLYCRPEHAIRIGYRVIAVCAEAELGAEPGNTTTRVPTVTRLYRSATSSLVSLIQPEDTKVPMVDGWLVPWMRYSVLPRYMARAPSGLVSPPAMKRGR